MKKHGILNSAISKILSDLGHTDTIVIADCGLPIPENIPRIDLALTLGQPGFLETLDVILEDMECEHVSLAEEMVSKNRSVYEGMSKRLKEKSVTYISHEELKKKLTTAKAVIRTGEATPYANAILRAGVIF